MVFNFTSAHLMGFVVMASIALMFVSSEAKLLRIVVWMLLWQLFTPTRPAWFDLPLMMVGFLIVERCFIAVRVNPTRARIMHPKA
jgi:hypothetical protein